MFSFPALLSLLIGFLSLSQEILWVRIAGFAFHTAPPAFSFVLVFYLVGIAFGAALGKQLCARTRNLYGAAAIVLSIAALTDAAMPALVSEFMVPLDDQLGVPALLIMATAGLKSTLFPIVHHLGSFAEGPRVGRSVSRIYFANIVGGTLGPLVTGFVALDYLSIDECFAVGAAACLVASVACVFKSGVLRLAWITLAAVALSGVVGVATIRSAPGLLGPLAAGGADASMTHFISNRHGVIHTVRTAKGEVVFGGNVYDGVAEVDVDTNVNRLDRVYLLALMHPNPRRVLFVGMATGAWVRAVQGFPEVERIDVVEINPGYLELIRAYPRLAKLFDDPRVHIHIDDGRRWLRRNPDERFDLIVQNTTYYWRANAGNLLSREYFAEVSGHLNPGGVVTLNTTSSNDVLATAQAAFAYAYRYTNFVYAADQPLALDKSRLTQVRRPDGPLFETDARPDASVAAKIAAARLDPVAEFLTRRHAEARVITDDNLVSEYRDGLRFGPVILQAVLPPLMAPFLDAW